MELWVLREIMIWFFNVSNVLLWTSRRKSSRNWWIHNSIVAKLKMHMFQYVNIKISRKTSPCKICFWFVWVDQHSWTCANLLDCVLCPFVYVLLCNVHESNLCLHLSEVQEIHYSFCKWRFWRCIISFKTWSVLNFASLVIVPLQTTTKF